jgi:hypothetical protein
VHLLHTLLGYPVFLLGIAGFAYALWGWLKHRPYQKRMWDLAAYFTVSMYLQVILGFLLVFSTTNRAFDRTLGLHMVLSMVAAVMAHMTYSANRRRSREERKYTSHVWGLGLALLLVAMGILVIGGPPVD